MRARENVTNLANRAMAAGRRGAVTDLAEDVGVGVADGDRHLHGDEASEVVDVIADVGESRERDANLASQRLEPRHLSSRP